MHIPYMRKMLLDIQCMSDELHMIRCQFAFQHYLEAQHILVKTVNVVYRMIKEASSAIK